MLTVNVSESNEMKTFLPHAILLIFVLKKYVEKKYFYFIINTNILLENIHFLEIACCMFQTNIYLF